MSASSVAADTAILLSGVTAAGVLFGGWRRRITDAARKPFLAGETAIADAKSALEFRAQRIEQLTQSEATLKAQLTQAQADVEVLRAQSTDQQARLYRLEGEKRELMERAEAAEAGGRAARGRITELEEKMDALQRKLSLGPDGGF